MNTRPFPWAEAMAFGLGRLQLAPDMFWGMTLPEFTAAIHGASGALAGLPPIERAALNALIERFPDPAPQPFGDDPHAGI